MAKYYKLWVYFCINFVQSQTDRDEFHHQMEQFINNERLTADDRTNLQSLFSANSSLQE